jgi:hypothetical protein
MVLFSREYAFNIATVFHRILDFTPGLNFYSTLFIFAHKNVQIGYIRVFYYNEY